MKKLLDVTLVLSLICFGSLCVYSCTRPGTRIERFDRNTYVFIGRVTGYIDGLLPAENRIGLTAGLQLEVTGIVFVPQESKIYTVFPLHTMSDCSAGGIAKKDLQLSYPLGTIVRVVARKNELVPQVVGEQPSYIEAGYADHTEISLNSSKDPLLISNTDTVFDYSVLNANPDLPRMRGLVLFEIQKDLFRLENAKTTAEVETILKRLERAPNFDALDLSEIRREYIMRNRN